MKYLKAKADEAQTLPAYGSLPETHHVFGADSIEAVNAALASDRPLLLRGEPGTGKSQLARAVAADLGRAFLSFTVDARSESRDLQFTIDTVTRLAEAQIAGHLPDAASRDLRAELAEKNFTKPGPLWWAFDWKSALDQADRGKSAPPWVPRGWSPKDGSVLLIDEIDKADSSLPNGLLEALGQREFRAPGGEVVAAAKSAAPPVVLITTNEERALPDAFVRRCLVHHLSWPEDSQELQAKLMLRGAAHFPALEEAVLSEAASLIARDRAAIAKRGVCPPGGAEYLDLLRTVAERWRDDPAEQEKALRRIAKFVVDKHPKETAF